MTTTVSPSSKPARRFLAVFFGVLGTGLLAVMTLNILVDPFGFFRMPRISRLSDRPPPVVDYDRMYKPYELVRAQPRTVLLGSSTFLLGFDTARSQWPNELPKPAFNYSLLGANIHQTYLSLAHALRETPAQTVIMGADFFAYNANYTYDAHFDPERLLSVTRHGLPGFMLDDLCAFTLGLDALDLSWKTIVRSHSLTQGISEKSSAHPTCWTDRFRKIELSYLLKWFPAPTGTYVMINRHEDCLADYDTVLHLCTEKGVRLIVIIPPIHQRFQETIATAGAWSHYETFKRALVAHTRAHLTQSTASGKTPAIELWDFSLFNDRARETIPLDGGSPMQWWLDSAHFTAALGHDILEEIHGHTSASHPPLGVRLAPGSVALDAHLASIRADLTAFRQTQPNVVADVRATLGISTLPPLAP